MKVVEGGTTNGFATPLFHCDPAWQELQQHVTMGKIACYHSCQEPSPMKTVLASLLILILRRTLHLADHGRRLYP